MITRTPGVIGRRLAAAGIVLLCGGPVPGADWPTYRHDPQRSACTAQQLGDQLRLQWVRQLPERSPLFIHDLRTCPDFSYEPIVAGKTLYVGLDADGSLVALDTASGEERWRFYTEAPIRFAPVVWNEVPAPAGQTGPPEPMIYVGSDDGCLYGLSAADGRLIWKFVGAPSPRKIIHNERVASNWPVSTSPLVKDGVVYFACGIWPIDGVLLYAVDARTGKCLRRHVAFDRVVLGYTCLLGDLLVLPSGGLHLSVFDPRSGAWHSGGGEVKNRHTCEAAALGDANAFCGNKAYAVRPGRPTYYTYLNAELGGRFWPPVISGTTLYGINEGVFRSLKATAPNEIEAGKPGKPGPFTPVGGEYWINSLPPGARLLSPLATPGATRDRSELKELPVPASTGLPKDWYARQLHLKAGNRLYAGGPDAVVALSDPTEGRVPSVTWVGKVQGHVTRIIAADDRLFVVVREGRLYCFAASPSLPPAGEGPGARVHGSPLPLAGAGSEDAAAVQVAAIQQAAGQTEGYCVVWGLSDGRLTEQLRRKTALKIVAVDADEKKVQSLRRRLAAQGLLSNWLDVRHAPPCEYELPPYLANLIVSEDPAAGGIASGRQFIEKMFAALRPYGGTACLGLTAEQHMALEGWVREAGLANAEVRRAGDLTLVVRRGPLPGAAEWTHERCDPSNTLCAADALIRPPLGLLWCGGPASEFTLQGGHDLAHAPEVVEGRCILVGDDLLRAVDAYTGRLHWRVELPKVQHYPRVGPKEIPDPPPGVIPAWHISKSRGPNVVAMPDHIYACLGEYLLVLDTATGKEAGRWPLPLRDPDAKTLCWGRVRVEGDLLIATAFDPQDLRDTFPGWHLSNERCKDKLLMRWLFAINRRSGELLWKRRARCGFINNGIALGNGRVYCTDMYLPEMLAGFRQTGRKVSFVQPVLYGLDAKSGRELWSQPLDVLAPKLAYSAARDLVVAAYRHLRHYENGAWVDRSPPSPAARKPSRGEGPDVMFAVHGATGKPAWRVEGQAYADPVQINGDTIITRHGLTYDLLTGRRKARVCSITGQEETWLMPTAMCSFEIGSAHLVSRQAGLDDLGSHLRFAIKGIRPGCVPSMVPANGVLCDLPWRGNCPSAEFRAAIALAHRPEGATFGVYPPSDSPPGPIRRLALNFAAPGDTACDGRLWLAAAAESRAGLRRAAAGSSSLYRVAAEPAELREFREHPCAFRPAVAGALPAVAASGWEGVTHLTITWPSAKADQPAAKYTVRLHFAEPNDEVPPGQRVFSVAVVGAKPLGGLDIVKEAGGPRRAIVKQLDDVLCTDRLQITFSPQKDSLPAIVCGIEVEGGSE